MVPRPEADAGAPDDSETDTGLGRVLVVDDDPAGRLFTASVLVDAGYRVETSGSMADAAERLDDAANTGFGVVVLDPRVSDFLLDDGVEDLRAVSDAPIVIYTAAEIAAEPDLGRGTAAVVPRGRGSGRDLLVAVAAAVAVVAADGTVALD